MRTRLRPALAQRINVDPSTHTTGNTNFNCGGGTALFLSWKPPDQRRIVPNPKPDIQTTGNTNLAENVQADDRVLFSICRPQVACERQRASSLVGAARDGNRRV